MKSDSVTIEHLRHESEEVIRIDLKNPQLAAFLAWLIPGAGHFYQGRIAKGILFMTCILGTFVYGMYLGGGKVVYASWRPDDRRLHYVCQLGVGLLSLPAAVQAYAMGDRFIFGQSKEPGAPFWAGPPDYRGFMAPPRRENQLVPENSIPLKFSDPAKPGYWYNTRDEMRIWQRQLHRYFELGTVYTMIAGLLNVLAIYDALGGPLMLPPESEEKEKDDPDNPDADEENPAQQDAANRQEAGSSEHPAASPTPS